MRCIQESLRTGPNLFVHKHKYGENCLSHLKNQCQGKCSCVYGQWHHNSLLHIQNSHSTHVATQWKYQMGVPSAGVSNNSQSHNKVVHKISTNFSNSNGTTLLSTTILPIYYEGKYNEIHALNHQPSQKTFITSGIQKIINLSATNLQLKTSLRFNTLLYRSFQQSSNPDNNSTPTANLPELHTLTLSHPNCFNSSKIDMVIGSDIIR